MGEGQSLPSSPARHSRAVSELLALVNCRTGCQRSLPAKTANETKFPGRSHPTSTQGKLSIAPGLRFSMGCLPAGVA